VTARVSRRSFLAGGSSLVVGFTLLGGLDRAEAANPNGLLRINPTAPASTTEAWLVLTPGATTVYSGKVELGTGVQTALTQIVAEELRLRMSDVQFVQGDTVLVPSQGFTAGSKTLQQGAVTLRQAAATAYAALLNLAAHYLRVDPSRLVAHEGRFRIAQRETSVSYRKLLRGTHTVLPLNTSAPQVAPIDYRIVGTDADRVDLPAKLTAQFRYTTDVTVPGMLHGRVVRPSGRNASFNSIGNLDRAQAIPGFVRVVQIGNFVGVVATSEWAAARAANPTTGVTVSWTPGPALVNEASLPTALRDPANQYKATVELDTGDVDAAFASAAKVYQASYFSPFHMHGAVGASSAVADVRPAPDASGIQATVWSGTQGVNNLRGAISGLLGLSAPAVRVLYTEAAGCYGHNGADDAAADAALLSQIVGKPVRVQWTRQNEHGWEPLGPAQAHDMRGVVSSAGITAWMHTIYAATHGSRPSATNAGTLLAGQFIGKLPDPLPSSAGDASGRNSEVTYTFANQRMEAHLVKSFVTTGPTSATPATPLVHLLPRSSSLRSLGGLSNTFANESFFDELALAGGFDPFQLRLDSLTDPRALSVLDAIKPAWRSRPRGGNGVGAGVAYQQYELVNAYVATYVEVAVDAASGKISVQRVVVAHDCGLIINPDGLRHQIEGNVIQGISRTLKEEVHYAGDAITTLLWAAPPGTSAPAYSVIRFNEVPPIETILVDRPDQPVLGAGEPAIGTMAAAIGNAVFAACGARLRTLPMTAERVKAALP
jgi:CO/xanthine dehydrogenase Mo-binding subunit